MATCVHCQRSKGKRPCPALGGAICSSCCGQHRQRTISCPSDCRYLGGLALVAAEQPVGDFPKETLDAVVQKLMGFSASPDENTFARQARDRFFGGEGHVEVDEWDQNLFLGYLLYGHRDRAGHRLVDRFAERRGRDLGQNEALAARSLRASWASFFEVRKVHLGAGFELADLLTDELVRVDEVSGSYQLRPGDALFSWLMPIGVRIEMVGVSTLVPEGARAALREQLRAALAELPSPAGRDVGNLAQVVYAVLRHHVASRPMPKLANTDGEELVMCRAHYAVIDAGALRERLARAPGIELDGDVVRWTGATDQPGFGGVVSLGRAVIDGDELVLEVNSRQRLERGKALLEKHGGAALRHRVDSLQDVESMMREPRSAPPSPRQQLAPEVQAELLGRFLGEHYAAWPDMPLPALGGKTPRQAAKTKRGRAKVRALLDDIEEGTLEHPGGETVDFGAIRRGLGLDEQSALHFDASKALDAGEWLALDEDERLAAVESGHRGLALHPKTPNPRVHAIVHVIVENQLAIGQPPETREALDRLCASGLSRHEAIHAIGAVATDGMFEVLREHRSLDRAELARRLEQLRGEEHAGTAP